MGLTDKIRQQHIAKTMQELVAKPHRKSIVHLDKLKTIGLIVQNPTDKDKTTISQFNRLLEKRNINLRIPPQPMDTDNNTDKYGLPKDNYLEPFTRYHYDLIIDATPPGSLFGAYVTLSASSNLRIGYSIIGDGNESGNLKEVESGKLRECGNAGMRECGNVGAKSTDTLKHSNINTLRNDIYDLTIIGHSPLDLSTYLTEILKYLVQIRKI